MCPFAFEDRDPAGLNLFADEAYCVSRPLDDPDTALCDTDEFIQQHPPSAQTLRLLAAVAQTHILSVRGEGRPYFALELRVAFLSDLFQLDDEVRQLLNQAQYPELSPW